MNEYGGKGQDGCNDGGKVGGQTVGEDGDGYNCGDDGWEDSHEGGGEDE